MIIYRKAPSHEPRALFAALVHHVLFASNPHRNIDLPYCHSGTDTQQSTVLDPGFP